MSIDIHPAAFDEWVVDFVRLSNRAAGIVREPTVEEIAAHRGLFAANTLRLENLEIFVGFIEPDARLRRSGIDEAVGLSPARSMRDDLETLLTAAMRRAVPPLHLFRTYVMLQPFTSGNDRSGRAFWMWQAMRGTRKDLNDLVELYPRGFAKRHAPAHSTIM